MRTLYNILFVVGFCLSAPFYFWKMWRRGNWREGFRQRFGRFSATVKHAVTNRHVLWMHAVSVGEVNLCAQLIRALEPRVPNLKIVVSTTTSTGMGELRRKLPGHIEKVYYPIDFRSCVSRSLGVLHPDAIVLVEAEIWPNFLWKARARRTPVFLVNARLSPRSYRGYRWLRPLFRPLFATFAGVGAQTEADAKRLLDLGCRPQAVRVVGSLKFDAAKLDERRLFDAGALLRQLGSPPDAPILVAGSTHAGEEAMLTDIFRRLRPRHPDLFLVLVPRHFERGREVGRELETRGVKFIYRREVTGSTQLPPGHLECLLVNTTGELKYFYEEATVIFVGKSLVGEGGQNPIEPGALGKAMVFGPNMQNFAAIAASFVQNGGAVQVKDAAELELALDQLLADPARRAELGRNALAVVKANTGAIERTVDMIVESLAQERGLDDAVAAILEACSVPAAVYPHNVFGLTDRHLFALAVVVYGASTLYSIFLWRRGFRKDNRIIYLLLFAAMGLQSVAMAKRGFSLSRCPVNNLFEATIFSTWAIVATYLVLGLVRRLRFLGAFAAPVLFGVGVFALMPGLDTHGPQPQFKAPLSSLHASLIMLAYGAFGLGAIAAVMYLTQERDLKQHKLRAVLALLPPIQRLEVVTSRALAVGLTLLSVGMVLGTLWLKREKGVFFMMDAKILWTVFVWLVYVGLLVRRWRFDQGGRRFAWGAIASFGFVLLTFTGFNLLSTIHNP